ncbi:Glutamyl/glutaminyl-tRNA synthetase, class Ic, catalytic domain-containing protein [Alkalidesulfovibrio alkalitolerans DSM 16529]|uniref:Glutamyl/glutaminyl-tRNA synthetase, class Ic, catalytic domain-containing protein n=2 Tax=Alkalidesulfovibrio alkalitolerans TaxID=293256 RepID=S7UE48_9BACT|nr:Glutamyl/glutaminyl-tRNA synthetase, class Ic, catalytic domain-containing protein [Alkalidesulfovibrio alkalitolerans DSM 16529]
MHLGNSWASLLAWLAAKSRGGSMILRIEDIDPQRSRPEYIDGLRRDLEWLGLTWDEGPDKGGPHAPYLQSERTHLYQRAVDALGERGLIYPCFCTRKELRSLASAPHAGEAGPAYPGLCARLSREECAARLAKGRSPALRLRCANDEVTFVDLVRGRLCLSPASAGDVAVRRSDGVWAYQLAVVVDDIAMGVTQVVRGEDLLDSTPSQAMLFSLLGGQVPEFWHVPLLVDHEGERLAKRHRSLEIAALREMGVAPGAVIGWLAARAGLLQRERPTMPDELLSGFSTDRVPHGPVVVPADLPARLCALS